MRITILDTAYHLSLLAELGKPSTYQPRVSELLADLYASLFGTVVSNELECVKACVKTRMIRKAKSGVFCGHVIRRDQKAVVADVIRAGIEPSDLFYHKMTSILEPHCVRQDHIMSQRVETGAAVEATDLLGSKIGGSIEGAIVFIPDPMGATGHSMQEVMEHYIKHYGMPKRFVPVNLVVTPIYLQRLKSVRATVHVYAARKDPKLTPDSYIVPGLGGVGELINNTRK